MSIKINMAIKKRIEKLHLGRVEAAKKSGNAE
jgi:hypothetical protein